MRKLLMILLMLVMFVSISACSSKSEENGGNAAIETKQPDYYGVYRLVDIDYGSKDYSDIVRKVSVAQLRHDGYVGEFEIGDTSIFEFEGKMYEFTLQEEDGAMKLVFDEEARNVLGDADIVLKDGKIFFSSSGMTMFYGKDVAIPDPKVCYGTYEADQARDLDEEEWKPFEEYYEFYGFDPFRIELGETNDCLYQDPNWGRSAGCEMYYEMSVLIIDYENGNRGYYPIEFTDDGLILYNYVEAVHFTKVQ